MKRGNPKYIAILVIILTFFSKGFAQNPEKIAYQAVVRDGTNLLLASQAIGVQITILRGATAIYVETHNVTTNLNALLSVEVGMGSVVSGQFDTIAWHAGVISIRCDIDPAGGTAYSITGSTELLSVPYALYAKEAINGFSGDFNDLLNKPNFSGAETKVVAGSKVTVTGTGEAGTPYMVSAVVPVSAFEHYIGEPYLGGIIFYIYAGGDGLEYDLIVHPSESAGLRWHTASSVTGATSTYDGKSNMNLMPITSPAKIYVTGLGVPWYLPSIDELNLLWQNRFLVNQGIESQGYTPMSFGTNATDPYWSSTEYSSQYAWYMSFNTGNIVGTPPSANPKTNNRRIRAIRSIQAIIGTQMGGGVVAYVFKPGETGYVPGEVHGLILSNNDLATGVDWGCWGVNIIGGTSPLVGDGLQNTLNIVATCGGPGIPATICNDYVNPDIGTGVYSDWYLPTQLDLAAIAKNVDALGSISAGFHVCSSDGGVSTMGWFIDLLSDSGSFLPRTTPGIVRAVRNF